MADTIRELQSLWAKNSLHANFGPALKQVRIKGFRGISDLTVTFESPITAFCGTNGSGKSTIVQLLSCAYRPIKTEVKKKRYYVKDFFPKGQLDLEPFPDTASVEYQYATSNPNNDQTVTVSRATSEWGGYKRQPERFTAYVGFTLYIPKVERKDFSVIQAQNIVVGEARKPSAEALAWTQSILGNTYDDIDFVSVTHDNKEAEIGRLTRAGAKYSENNMGFGEGRVLYLVDLLESAPNNSLFVLEEPETSLHAAAQYALAKYLVSVTHRKKHQIFLSTHSDNLLNGLPVESRKFLVRSGNQVEVIDRVSSSHALSYLTAHHSKALSILVEDAVAKQVLSEIVRAEDRPTLSHLSIEIAGDKKSVAKSVEVMQKLGHQNAIAFRDGDVGEDVGLKLFSLPGTLPPEKEVIQDATVQKHMLNTYGVDIPAFLTKNPDLDHHYYFKTLAANLQVPESGLVMECARLYAGALSKTVRQTALAKIKANL